MNTGISCRFPKACRLLRRREFLTVEKEGSQQHVGEYIVIIRRPNQLAQTRLGITVSRRFGKAHQRNRFKRLVREAFRLSYPELEKGFDLIVKPRTRAQSAHLQQISRELKKMR